MVVRMEPALSISNLLVNPFIICLMIYCADLIVLIFAPKGVNRRKIEIFKQISEANKFRKSQWKFKPRLTLKGINNMATKNIFFNSFRENKKSHIFECVK